MRYAKPILLTSAGVYGELVTDITLKIDPVAGDATGTGSGRATVKSSGGAFLPNSLACADSGASVPATIARSAIDARVGIGNAMMRPAIRCSG